MSLLVLKVPQGKPTLGAKYDFPMTKDLDDVSAFKELASFLLTETSDPFQAEDLPPQYVFSGCMLVPDEFLKDTQSEEDRGWEIITSGTGSLVIRCENARTVVKLLRNHHGGKADAWKENLVRTMEGSSKKLYLKCRTLASGSLWKSASDAINETRADLHMELDTRVNEKLHDIYKKSWLDIYPNERAHL